MKRRTILFAIAIAMLVASCGQSSTETSTANAVDTVKVDSTKAVVIDTVAVKADSVKSVK